MMDDEGSKNDFGPAKPEGRSQTRPVEFFEPSSSIAIVVDLSL